MAKRIKLLRNLSLIVLALIITLAPAVSVIGEEVTLTTIMPGQDTLRVKRGAVGTSYKDSTNYLDADIGDDNLIIEGNVGIGEPSPTEKLEVNGGIKVGNTSGTSAGTIRWTGTDFEGYDGSSWAPLGGGALPLSAVALCLGSYGWGFMVATRPSDGRVYLRALETEGTPAYFNTPSHWTGWTYFGIPNSSSTIVSIDATITFALSYLWGYIIVRMADGKVYQRALIQEGDGQYINDPSHWTGWIDFGNPGT